jgi:leucyl-tRNA synthetase
VNEMYLSKVKDLEDDVSKGVMAEAMEALLLLLSPFVPHFAEEIWNGLGKTEFVLKQSWPPYDPEVVREEEVLIVVQVNGKLRDRILVPASCGEEEVKAAALKTEKVQKLIKGKQVRNVVLVPQKLVNIVC